MKRLIYFTMCLCTMMVVMSACSSKNGNEIIGKWEQTINENGANAVATYEFKEDGKLTQTFVMKNESPQINIEGEGTCEYDYADNTITFKFSASDFNFNNFSIEGLDDDILDIAMEQMKSQMVNMKQRFKDVKIDGDKLTAKFNGQQITLSRI